MNNLSKEQQKRVNEYIERLQNGTQEAFVLGFCNNKCKYPDMYVDDELEAKCRECELYRM